MLKLKMHLKTWHERVVKCVSADASCCLAKQIYGGGRQSSNKYTCFQILKPANRNGSETVFIVRTKRMASNYRIVKCMHVRVLLSTFSAAILSFSSSEVVFNRNIMYI